MTCLFVDPCGPYPERLVPVLADMGTPVVAVFTTPLRQQIWQLRWSHRLGEHVVGDVALDEAGDLDALATAIRTEWPEVRAIVPWDEDNVVPGARLAARLGLAWNPPEVIERCRDKGLMKSWLRARAPVRINASRVVERRGEALAFQEEVGRWPIVVKPTGGSGSEHVFFPETQGALLRACQAVLEEGSGSVLLEEYVGGTELSVNGLVDGAGALLVTDVWRYDRREVGGIPNLYYEVEKLPSTDPLFPTLEAYAAAIVTALGLRRAPIHMEVKVDDDGPCLIEVGARFGGISLPILASSLHGVDLFRVALRHYLGDARHEPGDVAFDRYDRQAARVLLGIQTEPLARITELEGRLEVEALPSFAGWGFERLPGSSAPVTVDLDTRAWEVLLLHDDEAVVADDAIRTRHLLHYR